MVLEFVGNSVCVCCYVGALSISVSHDMDTKPCRKAEYLSMWWLLPEPRAARPRNSKHELDISRGSKDYFRFLGELEGLIDCQPRLTEPIASTQFCQES